MKPAKAVLFKIGSEEYALDIKHVISIEPVREICRIPNAPGYMLGTVTYRGRIIPVIALRLWLGLESGESAEAIKKDMENEKRIIIVEHNKKPMGIAIGDVTNILDFDKAEVTRLYKEIRQNEKYVTVTVEGRPVMIVNLQNMPETPGQK